MKILAHILSVVLLGTYVYCLYSAEDTLRTINVGISVIITHLIYWEELHGKN